jgi:hypothetical protein
MVARPYLNQGDPAVANAPVGRSKQKVKAVGCTATAVAQAIRKLGVDSTTDAVRVMKNALAAWDGVEGSSSMPYAAGSAAAFVGRLGQGNGVVVHDKINLVQPQLHYKLTEALKAKHPVLMMVDKNGDTSIDHWLCALALDDEDVVYADPDGGYEGRMSRTTLEGYSPTGKHKYRVLGIRVITREA